MKHFLIILGIITMNLGCKKDELNSSFEALTVEDAKIQFAKWSQLKNTIFNYGILLTRTDTIP